ncbi:MAG: hypothetical protein HRU21_05265 [Pseudomonadales bacterium]|nr:hypothetical protein [Pseudomonadales bacterium]
MIVRDEGAWGEVTRARVYVDGGWRELNEVQAYEDNAWRIAAEFVDPLSVTITPSETFGRSSTNGFVVTAPVSATPSGGRGPFSYEWSFVSGSQGAITSPLTASTAFSLFLPEGASAEAVYRCTVTDNLGTVATSDVTAFFLDNPFT